MRTDAGFEEGVKEESPPSDEDGKSSPPKTLADEIKELLKDSNENNVEEPQGDKEPDPEKEPVSEPEPEPSPESKETEQKKPEDEAEYDDPADIPDEEFKNLAPKSQNRFQSLVNERNTATKLVTDLKKYQDDVHATIKAANSTPDQMADILEFTRMENSKDPEENRAALNLAIKKVKDLAVKLGVRVPGHNPLENHKDLAERVELGELAQEDAEEMALLMDQKSYQESRRKEVSAKEDAEVKNAENLKKVAVEIAEQFEHWRTTDPDWPAKQKIITAKAARIKANYPPSQFLQVMKDMKDDLDEQFRAKKQPEPKETLPSSGSSRAETDTEPKSAREAIGKVLKHSRI